MTKSLANSLTSYAMAALESQAHRAFEKYMTDQLKIFHINLSEWKLLGFLNEAQSLTPTQIARVLNIKLPIATRLLNELERNDYVRRQNDEEDSRIIYAVITPKGLRLVSSIEGQLRSELRLYLKSVGQKELGAYLLVLQRQARRLS